MTQKNDAAAEQSRTERLEKLYKRLAEVHEELRVITAEVEEQTRVVRAEVKLTRDKLFQRRKR